jgi:hypothetical protein
MKPNILSVEDLKGQINQHWAAKQASEKPGIAVPSEEDPQQTNPPSVTRDDGDDASKQQMPDAGYSATNRDGSGENNIPGGEGGVGEASGRAPGTSETVSVNVDKTKQQEDEAVTDPQTAKIAADGLAIARRIAGGMLGKSSTEKKSADQIAADLDAYPDAYRKIAHLVLGYEEGRNILDELAERELGKQAAENLIAEAQQLGAQEEMQQKQANALTQILRNATPQELDLMNKVASVHTAAINKFEYDFEKAAYDAGTDQAAAALDEPDATIPGDVGEDISLEEIAQVIVAMAQAGKLDPVVAEQLLAEIAQALGGGPEGGPVGDVDEAAAMAAAAGGEAPVKAASFNSQLDSLRAVDNIVGELF